jgi:hypothetical protein
MQFRTPQSSKRQQVIDQAPHVRCRVSNFSQITAIRLIKRPGDALFQNADETGDVPNRGAEIVRDGVTERFQFAINHREFSIHVMKLFFGLFSFCNVLGDAQEENRLPTIVI